MAGLASSLELPLFPMEVSSAIICVKLLKKLLPSLLAVPSVAYYILWLDEKPIGKSEDEVIQEAAEKPVAHEEEQKDDTVVKTPYGVTLIQTLINLLFKQNLTISKLEEDEKTNLNPFGIDIKTIWSGGLQYEDTRQAKERKYDSVRCEILYLLLTCLSSQIYAPMGSTINLFSMYATCGKAQNVKNLFFSLLNTVLSYNWKGFVYGEKCNS